MAIGLRAWSPDDPRRARLAALGGALASVAVVLVVWVLAYGGPGLLAGLFTLQVGPWLVYAFGGAALVGAVLAMSVVEYGLVSPTAVVVGLFAFALYNLWQALERPAVLLPGDPFQLYLVGWPAVLVIAGVTGLVERYVRAVVGRRDAVENSP